MTASVSGMAFIPDVAPGVRMRDFGTLAGGLVRCAVWIPYILTSQRVKATFVR
jgi:hypothetical protein